MLNVFKKMEDQVELKVKNHRPGLYVALLFPVLVAFVLTFIGSRIIGYLITYNYIPEIYWQPSPGLHVHHFTYGFFILALAGYLALIHSGPRARYFIALLHGLGLGLALDEFGMWLRLSDEDPARWSYDGLLIMIGLSFIIITAKPGWQLFKKLRLSRFRNLTL